MPEIEDYTTYEGLRKHAKNGDVLLVSGAKPVSLLIRAATFSRMSHIATFIWLNDGLWVFEAKEFQGLRLMPASLYVKDLLDKGTNVYFGRAPDVVLEKPDMVNKTAKTYRDASYGYTALFTVLLAQIVSRYWPSIKIDSNAVVCSILVQRVWEACGHTFPRLMSPGLFVDECQFTAKIRGMKTGTGESA